MQGSALQHIVVGFFLPTFDGTPKFTTKEWVEKLDTYFQLHKVFEIEAIKIVALHLAGEAQDWWFHGLTTLGNHHIISYLAFTKNLVERFDLRDPEAQFSKITKLNQEGDLEDYIAKYLQLSVMVSSLTMRRKVCMFLNGMAEPLQGLVNSTKPTTLLEAVEKARYLQHILPRARTFL